MTWPRQSSIGSASTRGSRPTTRSASGAGRASSASPAFVWLELAMLGGGPSILFIVLLGYTAYTLAMMAQFGRDEWRATARCSRSGSGCSAGWRRSPWWTRRAGSVGGRSRAGSSNPAGACRMWPSVGLGIGSILFDGLSQTQAFFDGFGTPGVGQTTVLLGDLPGRHRARGPRGDPGGRRAGDGGRPATDRGGATSSRTT